MSDERAYLDAIEGDLPTEEQVNDWNIHNDHADSAEPAPEGYYDVSVIVEGALDRELSIEYGHEDRLNALVEWERKAAEEDKQWTQIYIVDHPHALDVEDCACTQYLTDHRPQHEWNAHE